MLKNLFYILRALALMPARKINSKYKISRAYFMLSVGVQLAATMKCLAHTLTIDGILAADVDSTMFRLWESCFFLMFMGVRWSVLMSSKSFLPVLLYVDRLKEYPKKTSEYVSLCVFMIFGVCIPTVITLLLEILHNPPIVSIFLFFMGMVLYPTPFFVYFYLMTLMKSVALDLSYKTDELQSLTLQGLARGETAFFSNLKRDCTSDLPEKISKMDSIREDIMEIHRVLKRTQKFYSVPALVTLTYAGLELVSVVFMAMYDTRLGPFCIVVTTVFTAVPLWLLLDSQTDYLKACKLCSYRLKQLAGRRDFPPLYRLELQNIVLEIEELPKFKIMDLFELNRQCLLSMMSCVVTYVIVVVQFRMSGQT